MIFLKGYIGRSKVDLAMHVLSIAFWVSQSLILRLILEVSI